MASRGWASARPENQTACASYRLHGTDQRGIRVGLVRVKGGVQFSMDNPRHRHRQGELSLGLECFCIQTASSCGTTNFTQARRPLASLCVTRPFGRAPACLGFWLFSPGSGSGSSSPPLFRLDRVPQQLQQRSRRIQVPLQPAPSPRPAALATQPRDPGPLSPPSSFTACRLSTCTSIVLHAPAGTPARCPTAGPAGESGPRLRFVPGRFPHSGSMTTATPAAARFSPLPPAVERDQHKRAAVGLGSGGALGDGLGPGGLRSGAVDAAGAAEVARQRCSTESVTARCWLKMRTRSRAWAPAKQFEHGQLEGSSGEASGMVRLFLSS